MNTKISKEVILKYLSTDDISELFFRPQLFKISVSDEAENHLFFRFIAFLQEVHNCEINQVMSFYLKSSENERPSIEIREGLSVTPSVCTDGKFFWIDTSVSQSNTSESTALKKDPLAQFKALKKDEKLGRFHSWTQTLSKLSNLDD